MSSIFSNIFDNVTGALSDSLQNIDITDGSFAGNSEYGLINISESNVNAVDNYWNSPDGPSTYDSNTGIWSTNGDRIKGFIEYVPWSRTSPF